MKGSGTPRDRNMRQSSERIAANGVARKEPLRSHRVQSRLDHARVQSPSLSLSLSLGSVLLPKFVAVLLSPSANLCCLLLLLL